MEFGEKVTRENQKAGGLNLGDIFSNNKRRKLSHGWKCKDQRGEREAGKIQCHRECEKGR